MKFYVFLNRTVFLLPLVFLLLSCEKNEGVEITTKEGEQVKEIVQYSSDYKYNLNFVYFVPNDVIPNPNYEERLSKILIEGQIFYAKWMQYWGFGNITFGLLKNESNTRVKIHVVYGPQNASAYTDDFAIKALVETYFQTNPSEKTSDHYLVLTATNKRLDQGEELGHAVPFHGRGTWSYALDYPGMSHNNLGKGGLISDKATVYIGGLLHELGHGLNLPHNGPSTSAKDNPNFGMTLMGAGNYSYGKSPTYISFYDAATLSNCQVFSKVLKTFYGTVTNKVNSIAARYENGDVIVTGTYSTSVPAKYITFRNILDSDPAGYQSVTFTEKTVSGNSFSVRMPISEFISKGNFGYTLQLFFHHDNGSNTTSNYPFKFVNDLPVIDFDDRPLLPRLGWSIVDFSTQQSTAVYAASNVLDGHENTYWHTSWGNNQAHPHYISIQTGNTAVQAKGLSILTRHDNAGTGGKIKDFKVESSMDGQVWTTIYTGTMAMNGRQYFNFDAVMAFQYFKIVSLNDYEEKTYATLAEVDLY